LDPWFRNQSALLAGRKPPMKISSFFSIEWFSANSLIPLLACVSDRADRAPIQRHCCHSCCGWAETGVFLPKMRGLNQFTAIHFRHPGKFDTACTVAHGVKKKTQLFIVSNVGFYLRSHCDNY
jgi:hypothetical protein